MSITLEGDDIVVKLLNFLEEAVQDLRPVWESVADVMYASLQENFDAQGRPSSWAPLSPRTQQERSKQGFNPTGPILERTGELRRELGKNSSHLTWIGSPSELKFIPDPLFDKFHHHTGFVTSFGATVPARPFLLIQESDEPVILRTIAYFLAKGLQQRFA